MISLRDIELELARRGDLPELQAAISAAINARTPAMRWITPLDSEPTLQQQAEIAQFLAENPDGIAIIRRIVSPDGGRAAAIEIVARGARLEMPDNGRSVD